VEAVFRPEIRRIFSDDFRPEGTGSGQEFRAKNLGSFRPEYCFHVPVMSSVFLQDTVTFTHLSCRILRNPVSGIIEMGVFATLCFFAMKC
jgi:hypothetical protein